MEDVSLSLMDTLQIAEAVRAECVEAATAAYEDAGVQGLCAVGRWEAAIGALQSLDLQALLQKPSAGNSLTPLAGDRA
jgi:hypothetical protein